MNRTNMRLPPAAFGHTAREGQPAQNIFKSAVIGLLMTLPVGLLLIFIAAGIAYAAPDPDSISLPLSLAALAITSFAGGIFTFEKNKGQPVLCGLLGGALFVILTLFLSLLFGSDARAALSADYEILTAVLFRVGIVALEIIGAFVGAAFTGRQKSHRRPKFPE